MNIEQRRHMHAPLALALLLVLIAFPDVANTRSVYVLGNEEHPWDEREATLTEMDVTSRPGWIMPYHVEPDTDLLPHVFENGARAWLSWKPVDAKFELFGGGMDFVTQPTPWGYLSSGYFRAEPKGILKTWTIFLDLGGVFGVHRVRFYPLPEDAPLLEMLLREMKKGYVPHHAPQWMEVGVNRGDPEDVDVSGQPLLTPVWSLQVEPRPTVDARFPTRAVRTIGIRTLARSPLFNIAAIEVYGEGYVPHSSYTSPIVNLGDVSDIGQLRWHGEKDPDAEIRIRTRTGMDDDPNVYWRKTEEGELSSLDARGKPLTWMTYMRLPKSEKGGITYDGDHEHWSAWSGSYPFHEGEEGTRMVSPAPRRYLQIKVEMSGKYDAHRAMDFIAFDYSRPVLARQVTGEITPTEVRPSERTTFRYAIAPRMEEGDRGFDRLEIFTPVRVDTVRSVVWDRVEIPVEVEILDDPPRFIVHFPRVTEPLMPVEVTFDASVLRYGTAFRGRVFDSTVDEVPQWVVPGDAHPYIVSSTLSVKTVLKETLITLFEVSPNPFTPNGDGTDDETWISYDLLRLTEEASVRIEIRDLSGGIVRTVHAGRDQSGRYRRKWDGKDEEGGLVPPGVYLVRVRVEADALSDQRIGVVAVVY